MKKKMATTAKMAVEPEYPMAFREPAALFQENVGMVVSLAVLGRG